MRNQPVAEHRIAARLTQIGGVAHILGVGEIFGLDAKEVAEPRQDRGCERPMIVLDLVEIARRKAKAPGKLRLAQTAAVAQPPQPLTSKDLFRPHGAHVFWRI